MQPFEEEAERGLALRVGIFVAVMLGLGGVAVMMLGSQRRVLHPRVTINARFADVQGLREGAPVRLAGVNVGTVARLRFSPSRQSSEVLTVLEIGPEALDRIGPDSVARIGSQGLLGDKIIEISVSAGRQAPLAPGATIASVPPPDFTLIIENAQRAIGDIQRVAQSAAAALEPLSRPELRDEIQGSVRSLHKLLSQAERGSGLAHTLFYDPRPARQLSAAIESGQRLAEHLDEGARQLDALLELVKGDGPQLVSNVSRAAGNIASITEGVRGADVVKNLQQASADLSQITAQVKSGQGTVGALLMDPTVYEQLITVLGGVARSRLLRAAVRYAISRDHPDLRAGRAIDENVAPVAPPPAAAPQQQPPPR